MIRELDLQVGYITERLRSHGIENDTMIIFASDNGAEQYSVPRRDGGETHFPNGPLRGKKQ